MSQDWKMKVKDAAHLAGLPAETIEEAYREGSLAKFAGNRVCVAHVFELLPEPERCHRLAEIAGVTIEDFAAALTAEAGA